MKIFLIGILTLFIWSSDVLAQQQPARGKTQPGGVCANGYERCVKRGMRMGYSATEAGAFCTRRCRRFTISQLYPILRLGNDLCEERTV